MYVLERYKCYTKTFLSLETVLPYWWYPTTGM